MLEVKVRRTDNFLLAISIASGFTMLGKGLAELARDLDLTDRYHTETTMHWHMMQFANYIFLLMNFYELGKS